MKRVKFTFILRMVFLLCLLLIVIGISLFRNELFTLLSIRQLSDKPAYSVTYYGDYATDKYMMTGAEDWDGVLTFMNDNLANGVGKYLYGENNCSSFYAMTPVGDYILARNLDTHEVVPAVLRTGNQTGIRTLGMTNLRRGGWTEDSIFSKLTVISSPYYTLDGMNEYGLAIASSTVPNYYAGGIDADKITIHDLTVNRLVLDKAKNVNEAIELLKNYNIKMERTYPSHYMIADDTGKCMVIEFTLDGMQCIDKTGDYQIATNFLLSSLKDTSSISCSRYKSFDNTLNKVKGQLTINEALELLKENTVKGQAQWSVVYNLSAKTMTLAFADDYERIFFEIDN